MFELKVWAWTMILLSLCGKLIKDFLPDGKQSRLRPALHFLLSLSLMIVICSPWVKLIRNFGKSPSLFDDWSAATVSNGDAQILERMGETMKHSVDTAFPDSDFSLVIQADSSGLPSLVKVVCTDAENGIKIADFIEKNYGLAAIAQKGECNGTG